MRLQHNRLVEVALFPFLIALSVNIARILVSTKPGEHLFNQMFASVAFDRFPVVIVGVLVIIDGIFGSRKTQHAVYIGTALCLGVHSPVHRIVNILTGFAVFRVLELLFQRSRVLDFAQRACVVMLFVLAAVPDSKLAHILFSRPRFLIAEH